MKPKSSEEFDDFLVKVLARRNYWKYVGGFNLEENESVLEIGYGSGNISQYLSKVVPNGNLFSIDLSPYWINEAKKRFGKYQNIKFRQIDFFDLDIKDSFDSIVVHYILHDINENKRKLFVNKLEGLLKDEGKVFLREPIRESHGISQKEIKELFSNFKKESSKEYHKFPLKGNVYGAVFKKFF